MMKNMALAMLFFLLTAAYTTAEDKGLDVRPAGREFFEIAPREIVTAVFRVTNATSPNRLLIGEVELPDGWKLVAEDFPFELGANESIAKLLSFFVPEATPQGRYKVRYLVRDRKYPSVHDFYTIDVVVLPPRPVEKQPEISQCVVAGEEYKICFLIVNKSKTEDTIGIGVDSSDNVPFTVDVNNFRLGPSQSKIVTVTIRPDAKIEKAFKHSLRVTARIGPNGEPETQASALHSIYIIPRQENAAGKRSPPVEEQDTVSQPAEEPNSQAILTLSKKKL